jgi:hypothetical protein
MGLWIFEIIAPETRFKVDIRRQLQEQAFLRTTQASGLELSQSLTSQRS